MKSLLLTFILAFLIVAAGNLNAQILYEEHFDDGNMSLDWQAGFAGMSESMQPDYDDVQGWIGTISSSGGAGVTFAGAENLTDYTLEAKIFCTVNENTRNGLVFHYSEQYSATDTTTVYYDFIAQFYSSMGLQPQLRLRKYTGSQTPTPIGSWTNETLPGGIPTANAWHTMKVTLMGDQIYAYWDNQLLPGCPLTDNTYLNGYFGVYSFRFDGVGITKCDDIIVSNAAIGIENEPEISAISSYLFQNAPNPFNSATTIAFSLNKPGFVNVQIFNAAGQLVASPVSHAYPVGNFDVSFQPENQLASGVYFYQMKVDDQPVDQKRMLLIR